MREQSGGFSVVLVLLVLIGIFGALLLANATATNPVVAVVPTLPVATDNANAWQDLLRAGAASASTALPTIPIPTQPYVVPTLPEIDSANGTSVPAADVGRNPEQAVAVAVTPTSLPPTSVAQASVEATLTPILVTRRPDEWMPPPLLPPLSRDPLGRDHYWFRRPVDSSANNEVLFYYPYGSNGPEKENPLAVHHGIDMPNPVGQPVRAAGAGWVRHASDNLRTNDGVFENSPSYGNVVVIEHDFGYEGQKLWTLYAHLSAVLVVRGQRVEAGEVVGLVGETGRVSGPHVHFEVRMGRGEESSFRETYNPVLWMVPYVGTGVIAGRVVDARGNLLDDVDVTIRRWATGLQQDTTTTYVYSGTVSDVNADPKWAENFVVGDVPVGRYEVIATIEGRRVVELVDVVEGTTSFVELKPPEPVAESTQTPES